MAASNACDEREATTSAQLLRDISEGCAPPRECVTLDGTFVARLKAAAQPEDGGWVSTQEALAAHMLRVLWRACTPRTNPRARVLFWIDGRRHLGSDADPFGNWTLVHPVYVARADGTLRDVAAQLHAGIANLQRADVHAKLASYAALIPNWPDAAGTLPPEVTDAEPSDVTDAATPEATPPSTAPPAGSAVVARPFISSRLHDAAASEFASATADDPTVSYTLRFNNLSKQTPPSFGSLDVGSHGVPPCHVERAVGSHGVPPCHVERAVGSRGVPPCHVARVLSTAGPTVLLPAPGGGVRIYLKPDDLSRCPSEGGGEGGGELTLGGACGAAQIEGVRAALLALPEEALPPTGGPGTERARAGVS